MLPIMVAQTGSHLQHGSLYWPTPSPALGFVGALTLAIWQHTKLSPRRCDFQSPLLQQNGASVSHRSVADSLMWC